MGRSNSIAGQPLLLGAIAIFIAVVVVYFVYQADSGLPFVPTYDARAIVPDAENVAPNAEVRMAGVRIGRVTDRQVRLRADGSTEAVLELGLDKSVEPLPEGTTVRMRATSTLGGNYVEVVPGRSSTPLRGHPTLTAGPTASEVTLSDALQAYDEPTRKGVERTLGGYGNALVGRGSDLNGFIAEAPQTLRALYGASSILNAKQTELGPFIDGLARLGRAAEPVAEEQAGMFRGLDATLGALASVRDDVARSAELAPQVLHAGIDGLPRQRSLLRATTRLAAAVAPGLHSVRGAADDIEGAATAGPAAMDGVQDLAPRLAALGTTVKRFSQDPAVVPGLKTLVTTLDTLRPTTSDLRASQVVCNYPGILLRNIISSTSDGDSVGNWLAALAALHLPGPDTEAAPAARPSNGSAPEDKLHANPAPYTGKGPQGPECEAANEPYVQGRVVVGHAPGRQQTGTDDTTGKKKAATP
ncbi:MAG TPA: MlaD family protein [Solirubrobacteraceae bacterium]|nr:MlaD family protein [Solirubrobacteraceae bacterium]